MPCAAEAPVVPTNPMTHSAPERFRATASRGVSAAEAGRICTSPKKLKSLRPFAAASSTPAGQDEAAGAGAEPEVAGTWLEFGTVFAEFWLPDDAHPVIMATRKTAATKAR